MITTKRWQKEFGRFCMQLQYQRASNFCLGFLLTAYHGIPHVTEYTLCLDFGRRWLTITLAVKETL